MPVGGTNTTSRTHARSTLARGFSFVAWAAALGLLLALAGSRLAGDNVPSLAFVALMVQTFAFHAGLAVTLLMLVAIALRRWRLGAALLLCVLVTMGPIGLRALRSTPPPVDDESILTVLSCNIRYGTARPELLLAWIEEVDPDIILLQEYDEPFPTVVRESLQVSYPYAWQEPGGAHGQAIISRLPFDQLETDVFARRWKMTAPRATIEHQGRLVDVANVHVYPPMRYELVRAQLRQLDVLADDADHRLGAHVDGYLLVGDFNAPWRSNHLRRFAKRNMREAHDRIGGGRGATWGPTRGLLSLAPGIRIDHAIYGGTLEPVWSAVGPDVGSDHRPIAVGFQWR